MACKRRMALIWSPPLSQTCEFKWIGLRVTWSAGGYAFPTNVRNLAMESMYEYGSRVGVRRILESLGDAGVPATFFWRVNCRISSSVHTWHTRKARVHAHARMDADDPETTETSRSDLARRQMQRRKLSLRKHRRINRRDTDSDCDRTYSCLQAAIGPGEPSRGNGERHRDDNRQSAHSEHRPDAK